MLGKVGGPLLIALLASVLVGQLVRIPVLSNDVKSAPLMPLDLTVLLLCFAVAVRLALSPARFRVGRSSTPILAFALWGLAGNLVTAAQYDLTLNQLVFSTTYLLRWVAYAGVYWWALQRFRTADAVVSGIRALVLAITVFSVFGIIQSVFLPDFAFIVYPDAVPYVTWDPQGNRLVSTFLDPNLAGCLVGIGFLFVVSEVGSGKRWTRVRLGILMGALFATASRGAWLGTFVGMLVVLLRLNRTERRRLAVALVQTGTVALILVISLTLLRGENPLGALASFLESYNKLTIVDESSVTRILQWAVGLEVLAQHPLKGVGFNSWGFVQQYFGVSRVDNASFGLDGGVLFIAVLTGSVGLGLFLMILWTPWRNARKLSRQGGDSAYLGSAISGSLVLWVVQGFFVATLTYAHLLAVMWLLFAWVETLASEECDVEWTPPGSIRSSSLTG